MARNCLKSFVAHIRAKKKVKQTTKGHPTNITQLLNIALSFLRANAVLTAAEQIIPNRFPIDVRKAFAKTNHCARTNFEKKCYDYK